MDTYSLNVYYFPVLWQVNLTYKIFFFSQDIVMCTHICTVACVFILSALKADFAFTTVLLLLRFLGKIAFFSLNCSLNAWNFYLTGSSSCLPPPKKNTKNYHYMLYTLQLEKQATAKMWTGFAACRQLKVMANQQQ